MVIHTHTHTLRKTVMYSPWPAQFSFIPILCASTAAAAYRRRCAINYAIPWWRLNCFDNFHTRCYVFDVISCGLDESGLGGVCSMDDALWFLIQWIRLCRLVFPIFFEVTNRSASSSVGRLVLLFLDNIFSYNMHVARTRTGLDHVQRPQYPQTIWERCILDMF